MTMVLYDSASWLWEIAKKGHPGAKQGLCQAQTAKRKSLALARRAHEAE
jgi:hypothetical protein